MSHFRLGARSRSRLVGLHSDLVLVVGRAIHLTHVDFTVLEGMRSQDRQRQLVESGASQTMNSRHLTGHAVDLGAWVGNEVRWDWPLYLRIAEGMREASDDVGVPIRWGGTWGLLSALPAGITQSVLHRSFPDGPHFELPAQEYPS